MAISRMAKFMIASHRTEATELLEALQKSGICQILNAEQAMVSKSWPELGVAGERPRDIEELTQRLAKCVAFLKGYEKKGEGVSIFAPRAVVDEQLYEKVVGDEALLGVLQECERTGKAIDKLGNESENLYGILAELRPWAALETPVEELSELEQARCLAGLVPSQHFEQVVEQVGEFGGGMERIGSANNKYACLIVCLNENVAEIQKLLRAADFEQVSFEAMTGTAAELIAQRKENLNQTQRDLRSERDKAATLTQYQLKLKILSDHYVNLLDREKTKVSAPATEQAVILEGWVRQKDYGRLVKLVGGFGASSVDRIEPAEGEEVPVEIENNRAVRPFESITRLYGMPDAFNVDPTVFLAPFFAIFFGLCLTDAGYGFLLAAILWFLIKKVQGDKKMLWMFFTCSILSIAGGVITGGWFGDAIQVFLPQADGFRQKLMLFDPMKDPMIFFGLSLGLGYIQIMFGLFIALFHNIKQKDIKAAICDQVTWLVMLNSLILFGLSKGGAIPRNLTAVFGVLSMVPAITILLFSEREGSWGGRIGMGVFKLFCTVFYLGDVLSYVRIMALGMVTGGFGLAINIIVKLVADVPYVGWLLGATVFVGGHLFNIALSTLGSFVHSMRLQFVEFFPKFFVGGGKQFSPLTKKYDYIHFNKVSE